MSDLTPERLDQIEKCASAEIEARSKPADTSQLGRVRHEWENYLKATPPEVTLAIIERLRELEARDHRVNLTLESLLRRTRATIKKSTGNPRLRARAQRNAAREIQIAYQGANPGRDTP